MPALILIPTTCKTPVISLKISGIARRFILDTGATTTIVSPDILNGFRYKHHSTGVMYGVGTDTPTVYRVSVVFKFLSARLNTITTTERVKHFNMRLPFEIHGLIGQDVMTQFTSVVFDYKNMIVRFNP